MIQENISLKPFNTFGIEASTRYFGRFSSVEELNQILTSNKEKELLILGGGSNILLTKNFDGLTLINEIKGFEVTKNDGDSVIVKAGAGEVWHEFVLKCIENNFSGVENLSLIPGSVGASPMQNIGAYGVEIKDVFESVEAYHIPTGEIHTFSKEECEFGYRESVFKRKYKGQYVIISVSYKLSLSAPKVNTSYGAIESELKEMNISTPSIKDVSQAVINIRSSKLPNPKEIGNAGSFFKNPVISKELFDKLIIEFPTIPNYPAENKGKKIAAGWLIEQCGYKGKTLGHYGVHKLQALVLVNYNGATGSEIYNLSTAIIKDVEDKFGIILEREVNIL
ncbi:MAG: UDP-N-acetylmuramate dehydrogenase [Flavobacteriia bacterium]|nr:UDP-N-acetylmuramate dehydrogenase [Flavobacteriia bacterium]